MLLHKCLEYLKHNMDVSDISRISDITTIPYLQLHRHAFFHYVTLLLGNHFLFLVTVAITLKLWICVLCTTCQNVMMVNYAKVPVSKSFHVIV